MSFASDVKKAIKAKKGDIETGARLLMFSIGDRLVMRSPVGDPDKWEVTTPPPGYVGGRFRANWQHGYNTIPTGVIDAVDASGKLSTDRIRAGATASPVVGIHYMANNLPYAKSLEEGRSKQAPKGMVALTVVEFEGIVKRVFG